VAPLARMSHRGGMIRRTAATFLTALALTMPAPAHAKPDTLTVVTLNLWHDQSDWPRRRAMILADFRERRPDVICLQEVLQHPGLRNQAEDLADSLGLHFTFASVDPDSAPKRYGNAILSRHAVLATDWKKLLPLNDWRVAVHMRIDFHGRSLDLFTTHLHHTDEGGAIRAEQVRDLLPWIEAHRGKGAYLLAGDFNAPPTTPELAPLVGACVDVFAAKNAGADTVTTLNEHKGNPHRRIDHVFVSRDGKPGLQPLACERILDVPAADGTWASDHFGVTAKLVVR
jgi:endonuclease/exonuclease/phosphatase family metal-dependent hydrolase